MSSPSKESPMSFIHEKDFFSQLRTTHKSSVLLYRRSDYMKSICNPCVPELCSVRSASEIRQVARLLSKSAAPPSGAAHPRFSMIVAEVDHTIIKFMEVINKYYESEHKLAARLPLLLLMSHNVEEDLKQYVKTCDDVYYVMKNPFSSKDVFSMMVVMLHRRHVADDLFTKLTKSKTQVKGGQESSVCCSATLQEASSSIAEEIDDEDLAIDISLSNTGVSIAQYLESSKLLLPKDASKIRENYIKELKRNNTFDALDKYTIDAHERARIDEIILKNLNKGISQTVLYSQEIYETLSLEAGAESKDDEATNARTAVENDPKFEVDSCNIMSESCRPTYNANDSTHSNLFSSELLPFVDRVRPEMSKPRTVAGLLQKNATACWTVMKTKEKLCKKVEHKHDRPWSTPHIQARKTLVKPITDSQGTMTLETFTKIKDQITKQEGGNMKIMEEAIPVDTSWVRPKKNLKSSQHKKDEFLKDLEKTKQVLARSSSIALKKIPSRQNSLSSQNSSTSLKKSNKLFLAGGMNSLSEDDISLPEKSMSEDSHSSALGAMRDWRGVSETSELECKMSAGSEDFSVNTPKPSSARKLSVMLRSTGGINFGSLVVSSKARAKAKRMVNSMAVGASQDPQTSQLMWVNLENRHCSSLDRENLSVGINYLQNDKLDMAVRSFSKAIMVCKQVHIAMIYRGIVQYRRGKFFNALEDFTNASKNIESSNIMIKNHMEDILIARFNRGITYFRLGDDGPGLEDIKFALAVNPANVHVRMMLMQVQRRSSNYLEAVEHCISIKTAAEEEAAALAAEENLLSKSAHVDHGEESKPFKPSFSSPKSGSKHLKRGTSGFDSVMDFGLSTASDALKPKTVDVNVKIPENCFPSLNERKLEFMSKKVEEDSSASSMYLENFKHANGFKRHIFDTHFIRLSEVQEALIQTPNLRTEANKNIIMRCLKNFAIFCDLEEESLVELAGCVEYRTVNNKSVVFPQEAPVDAVVLVLSGQLQLRLEGQGGEIPTAIVSELNRYDMYGHFACIFHPTNTGFIQKLLRICQDADNGLRTNFSPQQLSDESMRLEATDSFHAQDLPRALQPGSFLTCKVALPTEMILVQQVDFDRLVRRQTEIQFFKRLELLKASGLFSGDFPYYDLVRLGRMCVLRRYQQGETILKQGEVPHFVFFIMKGICRVMKRPDPTEYLSQRLVCLRKKVDKFEELYTFHHSLRNTTSTLDNGQQGNHQLEVENDHLNLKAEIARLEILEAREIILEKKRRQEEKELVQLGHDVPDRYVDVSSLHWPQLFGEASILQPDTGVSAGTVVADTNCHLMCMHKSHLQEFLSNKKIIDNIKDRCVKYPSHEKLVMQLSEKEKWATYKAESLEEISKERWPGCRAAKPQAFYT